MALEVVGGQLSCQGAKAGLSQQTNSPKVLGDVQVPCVVVACCTAVGMLPHESRSWSQHSYVAVPSSDTVLGHCHTTAATGCNRHLQGVQASTASTHC